MALVFMAALFGGKALAATVTGRVLKFSWPEVGLVFGMTIPQAAATLAATLVGAEAGLFTDQVVNAVVFIVLVSIVLGSLVTRRFANRVELPAQSRRAVGAAVLVGLPGAAPAQLLVTVAASVAAENHGLVMPVAVSTRDDRAVADAERIADEATKAAEAQGADVEARVRFADSYAAAMLEAVIDRRASALVTPLSTEAGIVGRLFGGELERIGRESPIPVFAVRGGPEKITKVVLGLDSRANTPADAYDQRLAVDAARALAAHLHVPLAVGARTDEQLDALGLPDVAERVARQAGDREPPRGACARLDLRRARLTGAAAGSVRERVRAQPRRHRAADRGGSVPAARVAGCRAGVELPGRAGGYDRRGGDAAAGERTGSGARWAARRTPASGALVPLAHVLGHRDVHLGDVVREPLVEEVDDRAHRRELAIGVGLHVLLGLAIERLMLGDVGVERLGRVLLAQHELLFHLEVHEDVLGELVERGADTVAVRAVAHQLEPVDEPDELAVLGVDDRVPGQQCWRPPAHRNPFYFCREAEIRPQSGVDGVDVLGVQPARIDDVVGIAVRLGELVLERLGGVRRQLLLDDVLGGLLVNGRVSRRS